MRASAIYLQQNVYYTDLKSITLLEELKVVYSHYNGNNLENNVMDD